jgi:hypothetical protein
MAKSRLTIAIIGSLIFMVINLSCSKNLDFVPSRVVDPRNFAEVIVGERISIRKIEKNESGLIRQLFTGYLAEGDKFRVEPGEYTLSTKIEFNESASSPNGSFSSVQIKSEKVDKISFSVEGGKKYLIFNNFLSSTKWVVTVLQVPNKT